MSTKSWVLPNGSSCFFAFWQIVLRESRATLRKIALCVRLRDRFDPRLLKPFEQSELRLQYLASAWRSARKLQTLGKCSSTNLESFTFRLLTQPTQGIFLRSASFWTLFDVYFVKQWKKWSKKMFKRWVYHQKNNWSEKMLRNNTNFSH